MKRFAAITMVYNERYYVPVWTKYYGQQFGKEHCYIIDHGSNDESTSGLQGFNVVKIPRSPMHDGKRARFISQFCSSLLEWYDGVIYTDCDEMLVADPMKYSSLLELCEALREPTLNAIGLNVQHIIGEEPDIDVGRPILEQRRWARFAFPLCKPLVTTVPLTWDRGFHSSDQPVRFGDLILLHLHHHDLSIALQKLSKTREMPWGDGPKDHYQRWPDEQYQRMSTSASRLPRIDPGPDLLDAEPIASYLAWAREFVKKFPEKQGQFYKNNGVVCNELIRIPDSMVGLF